MIKQYKEVIYKTSAKEVGKTAHLAEKKDDFGHNGKFSKVCFIDFHILFLLKYLQNAGNPKNNGLNTAVDRERFMDGCKDWMDKNN